MIRIVGEYAVANKDPHPLKVEDFDCRRLVCATNAQLVAERHLIEVFKPIWNSEIDIAYGISKHGDSAKTRSNARSPWDVIHPGRKWALDTMLKDQTPKATILEEIKAHFKKHPPSKSREPLILELLSGFIQQAPLTSPEVARIEEQAEPQIED